MSNRCKMTYLTTFEATRKKSTIDSRNSTAQISQNSTENGYENTYAILELKNIQVTYIIPQSIQNMNQIS